MPRSKYSYVLIFLANVGPQPWACHFCDEPVWLDGVNGLIVHHLDHDRENNSVSNLVPTHWGCHQSYHNLGAKRSIEVRQRMSAAQTAVPTEIKRARSAAGARAQWEADPEGLRERSRRGGRKGGPKGAATVAKMKRRCCDCGLEAPPGPMAMHLRFSEHSDYAIVV